MASRDLTRQNGPFKYDVYLGFGVCDLPKMHRLQEKLELQDILCFPKYNAARSKENVKSAIVHGVARSQKCLLYVSQSFVEDQSYRIEVAEVVRKGERFSRDMIIVLKDPQLAFMPQELNGYTVYDVSTLESPGFIPSLVTALKKGRPIIFLCYSET